MERLQVGNWIKTDVIGLGFYEVDKIGDHFINLKCLRIFDGKNPDYKDHVTNIHHGIDKESGERIKIDQQKWLSMKVNRLNT